MEIWDLYDKNRRPLNRTHIRGEKMAPGEYHFVVETWTVNSKNQALVTFRDPRKESYPNKWENTGGCVLAGETVRQGAIRELREETGIIADESELIYLGSSMEVTAITDIFMLRRDLSISELTMQEGETVCAKWVSIEELDRLAQSEELALPTGKRLACVRDKFDEQLALASKK